MKVAVALFAIFVAAYAKPGVPSLEGKHKFGISTDGKIVGGEEVEQYSIPYQLSLQEQRLVGGYRHFCGASVLSSNRALTAAHCCDSRDASKHYVVGAEHNLKETEGFEQRIQVDEMVVHPDWSPSTAQNDICILKLAGHFDITDKLEPVPLPEPNQKFEGNAVVSGWGTLEVGGPLPDVLYKVEVPIVSNIECDKDYIINTIDDSMMCAGEEGKDSCQADSGGPMTCGGIHCGIVSWGLGCGEEGKPGVYTRTSYFIDFIKEHMD